MSSQAAERVLISYWIPYVGIGDPIQKVVVPLTDVLNLTLKDGTPQTNIVNLAAAHLNGSPANFTEPYLTIPDNILTQLTIQPGETQSNVQKLQDKGIKVVLSVMGNTPPGENSGMGWDHVPADQNDAFARWIKTEVIDKYGLDGIDIDDEYSGLPQNPQGLVDTVAVLRHRIGSALITKALWNDIDYFSVPASPASTYDGGSYLGQMLDIGSSMDYGDGTAELESFIARYANVMVNGQNVGMSENQLCIGVQAGVGGWMTTIADTKAVSEWVVENGYLGIMLYTFSQDIQQWTHQPQNSPGYMFPNKNDHEWQKTIIDAMWGSEA